MKGATEGKNAKEGAKHEGIRSVLAVPGNEWFLKKFAGKQQPTPEESEQSKNKEHEIEEKKKKEEAYEFIADKNEQREKEAHAELRGDLVHAQQHSAEALTLPNARLKKYIGVTC